jgi:hypothetical protein
MRISLTPPLAASLLAATLLLGGCSKSAPPPSQANPQSPAAQNQPAPQNQVAPTQDQNLGTLNSDGTRTAPAAVAQPQPSSTAASAPPPSQAAPQAAQTAQSAPPPPPPLVVPVGARVTVRVTEQLSASHNEVGDPFTGALAEPLVHHHTVVFPRGTRVAGTVVAAKGRGRFKGSGALAIELTSIGGVRVHTSEYEQEDKGRGKRSAGFIGGGTGLGGAGAGTAGAAFTGKRDVLIPSESLVSFNLTEPLTREAR